jgi:hypothetical protein
MIIPKKVRIPMNPLKILNGNRGVKKRTMKVIIIADNTDINSPRKNLVTTF